jgi:hypothetical protein
VTLSVPTFSDAADQAGMSRRYGGIHFERGDLDGRTRGRQIGTLVWEKAQGYIDGTAPGFDIGRVASPAPIAVRSLR